MTMKNQSSISQYYRCQSVVSGSRSRCTTRKGTTLMTTAGNTNHKYSLFRVARLMVVLVVFVSVGCVAAQEEGSAGTSIRKSRYIPKPAGPKLTGTLEVISKSSVVPRYGNGWIRFHVTLDGLPVGGVKKLPNRSKVVLRTICQQEHFYETVDITQDVRDSGVYTFHLKDDPKLNRGPDRPWITDRSGFCQTSLVYQYKFRDLLSPYGQMDYTLATSNVYEIDGVSIETPTNEIS